MELIPNIFPVLVDNGFNKYFLDDDLLVAFVYDLQRRFWYTASGHGDDAAMREHQRQRALTVAKRITTSTQHDYGLADFDCEAGWADSSLRITEGGAYYDAQATRVRDTSTRAPSEENEQESAPTADKEVTSQSQMRPEIGDMLPDRAPNSNSSLFSNTGLQDSSPLRSKKKASSSLDWKIIVDTKEKLLPADNGTPSPPQFTSSAATEVDAPESVT